MLLLQGVGAGLERLTANLLISRKGGHQFRSSKATDVSKQVSRSTTPVLKNEKFSVRILVDHSIVEAFAQGGRTCITSRVYPTEAISGAIRLFLFNNATGAGVTATLVKIWEMSSALLHSSPVE